ncbi:PIN domain-containing protein [Halogeometricum luteum]|uniref:PIN domain-containing protein n=1 Tax=Halogeometricum luteum TaxID=2950537 RepID=A0ABU2G786_9EURY|nr:PIN domain-containing protein [Halogeometricum sp. S3BR5-2]MDS0296143.1 PIN domain-containing protein [Halogeometricum sp. S3BR5-2]
MILDSTYLFDLMRDDPDAFDKGTELVERGEIQWLPTPVVAEAFYGVATVRSDRTESELRNRLLGYPRIELDEEIARRAGLLLARADDEAGGASGVGWNDAHIGATADVFGDTVLTENVADFEKLGVSVETY